VPPTIDDTPGSSAALATIEPLPPPVEYGSESPEETAPSQRAKPPRAPSFAVLLRRAVTLPAEQTSLWFQRRLGTSNSGWATSLLVHLVLLIALALIAPAVSQLGDGPRLVSLPSDPGDTLDDAPLTKLTPGFDPSDASVAAPTLGPLMVAANPLHIEPPKLDLPPAGSGEPAKTSADAAPSAANNDSAASSTRSFVKGAGLGGRDAGTRRRLTKADGGTPQSEIAMEAGLIWIANHQRPNGAWLFDHRGGACDTRCRNPGTVISTTGSTGLAIMAFLGAGYTHKQGAYQREVDKGLYYLTSRMQSTDHGGDLQEGTMYAHGIATIALCEAYAMTQDQSLRPFAQKAVDFIVYAQHPKTGGWRYYPGQPGDTTVLGWQLMALRSARMADLEVPEHVIYKATRYLDSVQAGDGHYLGAFYGYQAPDRANFTTTSVGLLCRMYTGWERSNVALIHGVDAIAKQGPSDDDMYYNYQATQVMHHWGGKQWRQWNARLRDHLIRSQARSGHEHGSWYFDDKHSAQGGRLYNTAMAAMMLQVYYRYLPLYGESAVGTGAAAKAGK
jgi:hypothetical protein